MHGGRRWRAAAVLVMALSGVPALRASVVVPMSLAQLTDAATLIVDGTVSEIRHVAGADGAERLVLVRVASTWKGEAGETTWVRLAGGRIGRVDTRVIGVPVVEPGDRLVWFLVPDPRGGHVVLGLHQGALRTAEGPGGATIVMAPAGTATARGSVARAPRRIEDLATEVRGLSSRGAGR